MSRNPHHDSVIVRLLTGVLLVYAAWLGMMAVHEFGHVLHAWITGGEGVQVTLPLIGFSRTELRRNPRPAAVAWGGVLWGSIIPLLIWSSAVWFQRRARPATGRDLGGRRASASRSLAMICSGPCRVRFMSSLLAC